MGRKDFCEETRVKIHQRILHRCQTHRRGVKPYPHNRPLLCMSWYVKLMCFLMLLYVVSKRHYYTLQYISYIMLIYSFIFILSKKDFWVLFKWLPTLDMWPFQPFFATSQECPDQGLRNEMHWHFLYIFFYIQFNLF